MKKTLFIFFLLLTCIGLQARKAKKAEQPSSFEIRPTLTVEEEQRFLYYFYETVRLYTLGRYDEAYPLAEFCCMLNPYDPVINAYMGDYYSDESRQWKQRGADGEYYVCAPPYALALQYYERAYRADTSLEYLPYRMEQICSAAGDSYKALQMLRLAEQRDGISSYSAYRRFCHYVHLEKYEYAMQTVENYLQHDPYNERFLLIRLEIYEAMKVKYKKKAAAYEEALAVMPEHPMLLNNYAYLLATHVKKGKTRMATLQRAEAYSSKAIQQEPTNGTYLDTYAWILYLMGEKRLAYMYIKSAIDKFDFNEIPGEVKQHLQIITNDL